MEFRVFSGLYVVRPARCSHRMCTPITRDGADWVRTESGVAVTPRTRVLRVVTRGHLIVRGSDGEQVGYRITQRVRARTRDDAHRLFSGSFIDSRIVNGATLITTTIAHAAVVTQLEVAVPRRMLRRDS